MNTQQDTARRKGHVKFFDCLKGYGFIIPEDPSETNSAGKREIFVHHTGIISVREFKSLAEGEYVEYDLVEGPNGLQASNVTGPGGVEVRGGDRKAIKRQDHIRRNMHHSISPTFGDNSVPNGFPMVYYGHDHNGAPIVFFGAPFISPPFHNQEQ